MVAIEHRLARWPQGVCRWARRLGGPIAGVGGSDWRKWLQGSLGPIFLFLKRAFKFSPPHRPYDELSCKPRLACYRLRAGTSLLTTSCWG